jgi:cell division septation protein DedD
MIAAVPTADPIATGGTSSEGTTTAIPTVAPPAAYEGSSAIERLEEKGDRGLDELKPMAPKPQTAPAAASPGQRPAPVAVSTPPPPAKPAPPPATKPAQPAVAKTAPPAAATGSSSGYVVQLAALNSRSEADAMAKRLSAKGYEAYVQAPADNAPAIFRVRVGTYPTRSEAENAAARLEKEGKFKPWVAAR